MRKRSLFTVFLICACLLFSAVSCSKPSQDPDGFYIYYRDNSSSNLYPVAALINENAEQDALTKAVYDRLATGGDGADYTSPVPANVKLNGMEMDEYNLRMNFNAAYTELSVKDELLLRAAVVKTMTQLPFVSTVEFFVENQPYALPDGTVLGPQQSRSYVDLIGNGLNAYTQTTLTLYFSTEDGQKLRAATQKATYNTQYSVEQVILSRLIAGPQDESQGFAILAPETRVLSVSTMNGKCSVDFNGAFMEIQPGVTPEAAIYSVVNSLTEISTISTVQISVNGSKDILFQDRVDLSDPLSRNLDYLEKVEAESEAAQ